MLSVILAHEGSTAWWVREPGIRNETVLSAHLSNCSTGRPLSATAGYPVIMTAVVGCCDTERVGLGVCLFVVLKQKQK